MNSCLRHGGTSLSHCSINAPSLRSRFPRTRRCRASFQRRKNQLPLSAMMPMKHNNEQHGRITPGCSGDRNTSVVTNSSLIGLKAHSWERMPGTGNQANNAELVRSWISEENLQLTLYEISIIPSYTVNICPYLYPQVSVVLIPHNFSLPQMETTTDNYNQSNCRAVEHSLS